MVTYTSAFLAAANLLAVAQAAPKWSGSGHSCQVVVEVIEGPGIWVPSPDATSSSSWSSWDPTTTTPAAAAWTSWSASAKASSTSNTWTWTHSTASTTSATTTWTAHPTTSYSSSSTTTTTTTTTTPSAAPTCSAATYDFNYTPSGSCGCQFTVDCNVKSDASKAKFWEQTSGAQVESLAACIQICNNNAACEATIWSATDPSDVQDYKRCWQVSGLGADTGNGFGQISRKGSCSGQCSTNVGPGY